MITYFFMGASALMAVLFMLAIWRKLPSKWLLTLKTIASLLFLGAGISAYFESTGAALAQYVFIATGLAFGVVGDSLLAFGKVFPAKGDLFILLGIIAFGLGHVMYIGMLTTFYEISYWEPLIALGLTILVMLLTKLMRFHYRGLMMPVTLYAFAILVMLVCAIISMVKLPGSPAVIAMGVGALLFVISDFLLDFIYFSPFKVKGLGVLNLTTYYAAQILIAYSLLLL